MAITEKPLAVHRFRGCDLRMWRSADHRVRFSVRDIVRALDLPNNLVGLSYDLGMTFDDIDVVLRVRDDEPTQALLSFLRRELAEYDRGVYGPVEIPAAPAPLQPVVTIATAAARIGDTLGRVHTSHELWSYLVDLNWVTKTQAGRWIPNPEQLDAGHLDVIDVPIKGRRDLYPQIHLTDDGLATVTKLYLAAQEQPA